jgi:aryl-alcohol dehydrogenase-like predicted oxidoreductase
VLDEEESLEIMKAAWDRGINTFDTANVYSNGVSEKLIAKFIEKVVTLFLITYINFLKRNRDCRTASPVTKSSFSPNAGAS